jgi:hypothetical protein
MRTVVWAAFDKGDGPDDCPGVLSCDAGAGTARGTDCEPPPLLLRTVLPERNEAAASRAKALFRPRRSSKSTANVSEMELETRNGRSRW